MPPPNPIWATATTMAGAWRRMHVEAVKWYRKAAEQGHAEAQFNLGCCYANGQGVAKDKVEAYAWFSMAAKADSDAAESRDLLTEGIDAATIHRRPKADESVAFANRGHSNFNFEVAPLNCYAAVMSRKTSSNSGARFWRHHRRRAAGRRAVAAGGAMVVRPR